MNSHPAQNLVVALCVAHARLIDNDTAYYVIDNLSEAVFINATNALMELSAALMNKMTPQEQDATKIAALAAVRDIIKNWNECQPHRWN